MRIRVDEIPDSGQRLHLHWGEDQLGEFLPPDDPFDIELLRPANVDLEVQKLTDHIRIQGTIRGMLQLACHRCLKPFEWALDESVDIALVPAEQVPEDDEKELEGEDLNYEFFDGEVIDVDQLIAEQIFLSLPFKVLCSEECRGLCPNCGVNLNDEACKCEQAPQDSPFAKLVRLKANLPDAAGD